MKKARLILTASLLTMGTFSMVTMNSCKSDDKECLIGYEGKNCDEEVRTKYYNTYRGTGTSSDGETYQNWGLVFSELGTDATKMRLRLINNNDAEQLAFDVTLTTNTNFNIVPKTEREQGVDIEYTGSGTVNATTATLTVIQREDDGVTVETYTFTFTNMNKE